jgi:hypothetical protein
MKRSRRFQSAEERTSVRARELSLTFVKALEGAPYEARASALVKALTKWIVEQGKQPLLHARACGGVLETLVEANSNEAAARRGARDVAA